MATFTQKNLETLRLVCDAMLPTIESPTDTAYYALKAADLAIADKILDLIKTRSVEDQAEFKQLLFLFESPLAGLLAGAGLKNVAALNLAQRQTLLRNLAHSKIGLLRKGFQSLKQLAGFLFYGYAEPGIPNPTWEHIQYPGPPNTPAGNTANLNIIDSQANSTLHCQVLVIGSGAGGGVIAYEMANAGYEVIVIDKGIWVKENEMSDLEAEMIAKTYEQGGLLTSTDGSIIVFAGATLGGGTQINWSGAFRTPDYVLDEWADLHDAPMFTSTEFQQSLDAVDKLFGVNTENSAHNAQNQNLWNGSAVQNHDVKLIPRNVHNCTATDTKMCGYCGFGCRLGNKLSSVKQNLQHPNIKVIPQAEAQKILIEKGQAVGATIIQTQGNGTSHSFTIKADRVVVAAGTIHSPALLMRSGLTHPFIGKNLHLHPVIPATAIYPNKVESWYGGMMTAVNDSFTRINGNFGPKLETPPVHSGLLALSMVWDNARQYKDMLLQAPYYSNIIVLTRDKFGGEVKLNKAKQPIIKYTINPFDLQNALVGLREALRIHYKAGAKQILLPHQNYQLFDTSEGDAAFDAFVGQIAKRKWLPTSYILFSAHQMATCRMGGNKNLSPVKPNGETVEVRNLFVADASAFPSASGANPMMTVWAIAHHTAQHLKK